MTGNDNGLQTVDRTLLLLGLLAEEPTRARSLTELSTAAGHHKTTTLRMLRALTRRGYAQREGPRGGYLLGPAALALGGAAQFRLQRVTYPALRDLTNQTGETCLVNVLAGLETLCVGKVESPEPIRVTYDIGRRGPLYAGGSGKGLLAFLEPLEQDEIISQLKLTQHTPRTITDPVALRDDLNRIREQEYAETCGELDPGVFSVGAPIWNHLGRLEACLTLVGPEMRWTADRRPALISATLGAAQSISHQLGHVSNTDRGVSLPVTGPVMQAL